LLNFAPADAGTAGGAFLAAPAGADGTLGRTEVRRNVTIEGRKVRMKIEGKWVEREANGNRVDE
jgi:hypothetical protein